jgi:quinol monooxygenase YgiN
VGLNVLVVMRFRVPEQEGDGFLDRAHAALRTLAQQPGYLDGGVGRSTDDPELWLVTLRWESVGTYRRALGAYDVRVAAVPLLSAALDEPTAFELLADAGGRRDSDRAADHGWRPR